MFIQAWITPIITSRKMLVREAMTAYEFQAPIGNVNAKKLTEALNIDTVPVAADVE